jgi:hypothetical protein
MIQATSAHWEAKRTDETRLVEETLRKAGFDQVDSYRYNPASIRVRVIDCRFEGLSDEQRDAMVELRLGDLPERTQADIIDLFTFAPSVLIPSPRIRKEFMLNAEFDDPSPSIL